MKHLPGFILGILVGLFILWAVSAFAETLTWKANPDPTIQGYKVYSRPTTTSDYGTPVTLGNVTTYTAPTASTVPMYYAVTAYVTGKESGKSPEVLWLPPTTETRLALLESAMKAIKTALGGY